MQSRYWRFLMFGALAVQFAATYAFAYGNGQGKGKGKGHNKHNDAQEVAYVKYGFRPHDREIISRYYAGHGSNLPPGLAKRGGNLPPGLEKQLERNGALPPGLQKRIQPFPVELERQLPPLPREYRRGVIGAHIILFNRNTHLIVDVFKEIER
jgi:hypothetical protein